MRTSSLAPLGALALFLSPTLLAQNCDQTSIGHTPLNDLAGGAYQGFPGGLYPGGQNALPTGHLIRGFSSSQRVVPRDAAGQPDPNGSIVFVVIGMSNAVGHFGAFADQAADDPLRDPRVVIVNTAQGGVSAEEMADPADPYWSFVEQRLAQAGVTPEQVQVMWMLAGNPFPTDTFPSHAQGLQANYADTVRNVHDKFPNTRLAYLGARIYAGYAVTPLHPEPWAYEQGFACKWLIQQQMSGDPTLNPDPDAGPVEAPWIAWGPYMWADGLIPRSDGLTWQCDDLAPDGTHPSPQGAAKYGAAILQFVRTDPTAAAWYLAAPPPAPYGVAKETSVGTSPQIGWIGSPSLTTNDFRVRVVGGVPFQPAVGFFGFEPGQIPLWGGTLYIEPPLVRLDVHALNANGGTTYDIPVFPPMVGTTNYFQIYTRDPGAADGTGAASSNGLRVRFHQ